MSTDGGPEPGERFVVEWETACDLCGATVPESPSDHFGAHPGRLFDVTVDPQKRTAWMRPTAWA